MQLGFIGLGAMGLPMTRPPARGRAPGDGGLAQPGPGRPGRLPRAPPTAARPTAVAEASEVVILCVPSSPQVAEVVEAMLPALGPGKVVVDCSTIDPEVARAQHQRVTATGAGFLDAPLSGGTAGAEKGTLTLMVGGDEATLDAARPALEPFAGLVVHVGGPGHGPGGQAVQQPDLRRPDGGHLRGHRPGRQVRCGHGQAPRGAGPRHRRLRGGAHPAAGGRRGARQPGLQRVAARIHDRPDGQGPRPGPRPTAASAGVPLATTATARQALTAATVAGYGREDFSAVAKVVFALSGLA